MTLQNQHRLNMRNSNTKGSQPQRRKKCTLHQVAFSAVSAEGADSDYWQVCLYIRTGYNNKTQARRSRVCTNFTCHLATLERSFIQVQIKFYFIALQAQRIRVEQFSVQLSFSSKAARCHVFFFYHLELTAVLYYRKFNCYFSVAYLSG